MKQKQKEELEPTEEDPGGHHRLLEGGVDGGNLRALSVASVSQLYTVRTRVFFSEIFLLHSNDKGKYILRFTKTYSFLKLSNSDPRTCEV